MKEWLHDACVMAQMYFFIVAVFAFIGGCVLLHWFQRTHSNPMKDAWEIERKEGKVHSVTIPTGMSKEEAQAACDAFNNAEGVSIVDSNAHDADMEQRAILSRATKKKGK